MRVVLLSLILLVQSPPKIESKYDRFTDKTTVTICCLRVFQARMRTIVLIGKYQHKGREAELPEAIWLDFVSTGDDRFDESTKLYVLHDEERSEYVANRPGLYAIALPQFEKIVNSKSLEMRVGQVELTLSEDTVKALRDFLPKSAK